MKKAFSLIFGLCCMLSVAQAKVYNVKDFGAKGDGVAIDSPAINAAIEAASANKGTVLFPKGTYLSFSIRLQSNITLKFEKGSVIKAAKEGELGTYDAPEPNEEGGNYQDFGHSHWKNSLIWGIGLENIKFIGPGLIDGSGVLQSHYRNPQIGVPGAANKAISMKNCKNVTFKDTQVLMGGHFAFLLTGVDNLVMDGVFSDTNRDAFDIDCCEHVVIKNCVVNSLNDDGIVLKCSYGLGWAKPTADVLIENCIVAGYDPGSYMAKTYTTEIKQAVDRDGPTGRVKLGTESNGGFRDITVRNVVFKHCRGLALETVDGAVMENIKVSHLVMDDICNSPIYIRIGDRMRGPKDLKPSVARNIEISDVKVTNCDARYALLIVGQPGNPIENVTLKDIEIEYKGGITKEDVRTQNGANSFFFGRNSGYPEPSAHGIQPAWGLSMQHARNITFKNVKMKLLAPDERDMVFTDDVENFEWK